MEWIERVNPVGVTQKGGRILGNAFGVTGMTWDLFPGCAGLPATLGFALSPLRGEANPMRGHPPFFANGRPARERPTAIHRWRKCGVGVSVSSAATSPSLDMGETPVAFRRGAD